MKLFPTMTRILLALMVFAGLAATQPARPAAAADPGNPFFEQTWQRTDEPVFDLDISRTWVWGPEAIGAPAGEPYAEAPGGLRLVQYFDKSRMEIINPNGDTSDLWYVTNGLLAQELITGRMQLGDNQFEERGPANLNIAGDLSDTASPTYLSFAGVLDAPARDVGASIDETIDRSGSVGCCVPDSHGAVAGPLAETGHRVASVFWEYLNSSGRIIERDRKATGLLFANPYYATGYPVGEAYWAEVSVLGVRQWVLVQPFERRVLTYTPGNAAGWEVEMGNVGAHYLQWRHAGSQLAAPPDWQLPAIPEWIPAGQEVTIPDIDATYDLHISEVNVDTGELAVQQEILIEWFNASRPEQLFLQVVPGYFGWFTLDSLTVAGQPAMSEARQGGLIHGVDIPSDLPTPLTVGLDFRLDVTRELSGWGGTSLDNGILRLGYWFPIISNDHPYSTTLDPAQSRVADFDVTVDVAADVVVAHSGAEVGRESLGGELTRYRLSGERMRDFALVLARGFSVTERTLPNGAALRYYSHVSSEAGLSDEAIGSRQEVIFATAVDAVSQLTELIGPYAYPAYSIVDVGPTMPGGLEFPGLIYINPAYSQLDRLVYHETAHQWLYAMIGNRTLNDGWIDEGGAEFFERGLPTGFTEQPSVPEGGYTYWLDSSADELPDDAARSWYFSIYEQGANFYYAVRSMMGNDAFWRAFRDIYARYAHDIVTPVEMLATFQEHSATDLRPLFDGYFRYSWVWELSGPGW
ncbi:MAG: M1 family aminopeptidase [Thermomicrobiales bacterium]